MQRITFHNNQNGLECTFASDTPRALLTEFDGNSLSAEFAQYKPIWYDGIRTKSHTFNGRTITFTVNWYAVEDGRRSREVALAEWDRMLGVFAPGLEGTLTWTNGKETRLIDCYANETPMLHEKAYGLFSASFSLSADFPFWRGAEEHSQTLTYTGSGSPSYYTVKNNSAITVYPLIKAEGTIGTGGGYSIIWQAPEEALELDKKMQNRTLTINYKANINDGPIYIDNRKRCVYQYSGGKAINRTSYYLSPTSGFLSLLPGDNTIVIAGGNISGGLSVTFSQYDYYTGVPAL